MHPTEPMTPHPYLFLAVFSAVAIFVPIAPLILAWLWRVFFQKSKPGPSKNDVYECGIESTGSARVQFKSQYYVYAMIFLVFDVEAIFLIPFAVTFTKLPVGAFVAVLVFVLLLVEGLFWAWSKGVLDWRKA